MMRPFAAFVILFCWNVHVESLANQQPALTVDAAQSHGNTRQEKEKPKSDKEDKLPTIAEKTNGMKAYSGFQNFYWDPKQGKIWLEVANFKDEFLYVESLATGLGSNPVGLIAGNSGRNELCVGGGSAPAF